MLSKNEFSEMYDEYFLKLYKYIYFRVGNEALAEDIVSETFLKALKNLGKYNQKKASFSTWIYKIASNTLIDYYKKQKQTYSIKEFEDKFIHNDNTSYEIDFEINLKKVEQALKKLPPKTQEIISLKIFEELTYKEIAKIIGISESGIKMTFF